MDFEIVTMRVAHILAGVIWAGSAIFLAAVLDPRLKALGPDVQRKVMASLAAALRVVLEGGATVTILVGLALVIRMGRFDDLLDTGWGWAMMVGLVTSVLALTSGVAATSTWKRAAGAGGGPSTPEGAEADRLSARATLLARSTAVLVIIAVGAMASARFV